MIRRKISNISKTTFADFVDDKKRWLIHLSSPEHAAKIVDQRARIGPLSPSCLYAIYAAALTDIVKQSVRHHETNASKEDRTIAPRLPGRTSTIGMEHSE